MLLIPQFIQSWNYDAEHDLPHAAKSCKVLFRTAASIERYILTYSL